MYGYSAYSASKYAIRGLAETLQMEVAPHNIGVSISFPPDTSELLLSILYNFDVYPSYSLVPRLPSISGYSLTPSFHSSCCKWLL